MDLAMGLHHLCPMETITLCNAKPPPGWFREDIAEVSSYYHGTLPTMLPRIMEYGLAPVFGTATNDIYEVTGQCVPGVYVCKDASQAIL